MPPISPLDGLQARLAWLQAERAAAVLDAADTHEIDADIEASRAALVGEAVAAIAMLRADLNGALLG
jgi:hypothetical protein